MENTLPNEGLEIALGDYPPKGGPYVAVLADNRQCVVRMLGRIKEQRGPKGYFEITMSCGYSRRFEAYADIPLRDLPCACGADGHYLIRYKR